MKTPPENLAYRVAKIKQQNFDDVALEVFRYQVKANKVYARYLDLLGIESSAIASLEAVPFLPVQLFKHHAIQSGNWTPQQVFRSSGTSANEAGKHLIRDVKAYLANAYLGFEQAYGKPEDYCFLALLPAYLERTDSSLIVMMEDFIQRSRYRESGFFLYDHQALIDRIHRCRLQQIPTILFGVSFALLDLAEQFAPDLQGIIVMETGGMKGRRREITRRELHQQLCQAFGIDNIHSEYGMTELLSQAYSEKDGIFRPSPTLRVFSREITDPFELLPAGRNGVLNIVDLANLDSCSFIATEDLGRVFADGSFEVSGRLDGSDIRGCNLLLEEFRDQE